MKHPRPRPATRRDADDPGIVVVAGLLFVLVVFAAAVGFG